MAGELALVTPSELDIYAQTAAGRALTVALTDQIQTDLHYYADDLAIPQMNLDSIRKLGRTS
jgi:hypothetical protein